MPNMSAYRPDYLFRAVIDVWEISPLDHVKLKTYTDNGIGKWSHAGLSLFEDIASSTGRFCAILSRDWDAQERSLSFTYGRPEES